MKLNSEKVDRMAHMTFGTASYANDPSICSHPPRDAGIASYMTVSWEDDDEDRGSVTLFVELNEAESLARKLFEIAGMARQGIFTGTATNGCALPT